MGFPVTRMRRLRISNVLREMLQATRSSVNDFIYPLLLLR